jgi:catechol 2,3-dioxygenase-like lactoylglutathione lyase family enzyme
VRDVGPLLGSIASGVFQQAYVVADLAAAEAAMRSTLGCGPFVELPASDLEYELRGEPITAALAIGFARSGNVQIELIQPVRGAGLHVEFLESNGPGLHHLGFLVDNLDATVALARECGAERLMGSTFGSLRFCYVDTFDELGVYAELVEDPDGMMMSLMPWRG